MKTQDVRNQVMERINGKMPSADDERYEIIPMTFNEAVRTAQGYREELGLSGAISIAVEHYSVPTCYERLEWRAFYFDEPTRVLVTANTAETLMARLRLSLLELGSKDINLAAVGIPALASDQPEQEG